MPRLTGNTFDGLPKRVGARRIEGQIDRVSLSKLTGCIEYLQLKDGQQIAGDLFIDCTGFRALLIEDALKTGFDDWSHWLPCNRAWAVQTELTDEPVPYTRAIAHDSGWRWRIPLQHRVGNGLVYCNHYLDDNAARERLLSSIEGTPIIEPRPIRFVTGQRKQYWHKKLYCTGIIKWFYRTPRVHQYPFHSKWHYVAAIDVSRQRNEPSLCR